MFRPSARAWALSAILTSSVFRVAAAESPTVIACRFQPTLIGNPLVAVATLQNSGMTRTGSYRLKTQSPWMLQRSRVLQLRARVRIADHSGR